MMLRALSLTIGQLGDRAILSVFTKSLLISLILCVGLGLALGKGFHWLISQYLPAESSSWMDAILFIGGIGLAFLGFRAIAVPVTGFFCDEVVAAIERRHYPAVAGLARSASLVKSAKIGAASLARVLVVNGLALPAYLFLIFTGIGPFILFLALNAVLLGRDLAEMVVVRHLDQAQMNQWLRTHRFQTMMLGLIVTGLFLIPFVNLLAPIIGAGAAAHLFHGKDQ